ncbi:MAG: rod shape-determining protein RodA, partial [Runella slithyformis]
MARNEASIAQSIDWLTVFLYAACVIVGLFNVYASVYNPEEQTKLFDLSNRAGKQAMFAATSVLLITAILVIDHKFWEALAPIIYGVCIFMLLATLVLATDIKGSRSWIRYGSFQIQPAEFMKIGLALMLAKFISQPSVNLTKWRDQLSVAGLVLLPAVLILASKETGLTLVFAAFVIVFYREGLPGIYPALLLTVIGLFLCALFFSKLYIFAGLLLGALLIYWVIIPRYDRTRKNAINISVIFG